jgi:hypothetical protein
MPALVMAMALASKTANGQRPTVEKKVRFCSLLQ